MNAQTSSRIDDTDGPDSWERALLDRQLERLDQLADMGMAIAGAIQRQVTDPQAALASEALAKGAKDFARTSRAVRMTLALQSRLIRDFKTPVKAAAGKADNDDDERWQVQWIGEDDPRKVRDRVRRVAEDAGLDAETVERLAAEAYERMERDDVYNDIYTRSFDEIVARICKDLGLAPDRRERTEAALTSPIALAMAGGGPPADPGAQPGEERGVEGAGQAHHASLSSVNDSS